ncbi:S24 family peptidase [Paenibacillus sp. BC26]|uniref:S24 family peptidase n=1 Tax=Paenibacillus sp. BC26 TaxID=1881032 RepID=UPI0008DFE5A9|nr:S24 family peptidase [Paenibacillus sp. BC26]SFS83880.1 Peptidase S24-like [Paenibacillus sp. BC26]
MNYYKMLSQMVNNSGLTLKEISDKCGDFGVKITPSYISKLQKETQPPASEDVNKALARACGLNDSDVESFIFEGYIEKAPQFIKDFIYKITTMMKEMTKSIMKTQMPQQLVSLAEAKLDELSDLDFIKMSSQFLEVPNLQGESYITKDVNNEAVSFLINPLLGIKMPDDSMSPKIPTGSHLHLTDPNEFNDGDIIIAIIDNDHFVVRRMVKAGDRVILISENLSYKPIELQAASIKIAAKVKAVTTEL